ncbi:formyl transferase [Nguyenibacter sp. L1]|uniref:glucosamine inositolphosphorylceramide transferase family protein n=1 Tax=Nguyenibacter sp. L1 TaxID=3049350 RepID=UPI002B487C8C|nr:formyl transferase [Nguyenibacter sp. L1]WRH87987.1 formyl transferase [Nguyenibacter sp. L1]
MGLLRTDIWRTGIIARPMSDILARGTVEGLPVTWLPDQGAFRFLADPFGLWRDDRLHVFVEAYDYRDRIGRIEMFVLDRALRLLDSRPVLSEPWHLSYPVVIEDGDAVYLLPEAHRSGRLSLYRAVSFPDRWMRVEDFAFPVAAIDASPLRVGDRWWIFFSPPGGSPADRQSLLHAAFADSLLGPWRLHPANPLRWDRSAARPGGTPVIVDGRIILPTQDCSATYGGAITPLTVTELGMARVMTRPGPQIRPPSSWAPFTDGLHSLSAAGDVTLLDAKTITRSPRRIAIELARRGRRLIRNG